MIKASDASETEEGKELLAQIEEAKKRNAVLCAYNTSIRDLDRKIRKEGKLYKTKSRMSMCDVPGEEIFDDFNIYGGGVKIRVTCDHVYLIVNNGMDGDAWDRNNISTGGAGAYAYEAAYKDVETELRKFYDAETERKKYEGA